MAKALAAAVISVKAFLAIEKPEPERAFAVVENCEKVLCPLQAFGIMNEKDHKLREQAVKTRV